MKHFKFLIAAVLYFSLTACNQDQKTEEKEQTTVSADWKTIEENDYLIQYPDSFELNTSGEMGTSFFLLAKKASPNDMFRENINLLIQNLTGQNIDLDKYVEISEGQVKTMVTEGTIVESKRIKSGNTEYHKIIYTGVQGQYKLTFEQYYFVVNEKAYVLTFTSESDQYDNYKDVGEKIMNTFRIK